MAAGNLIDFVFVIPSSASAEGKARLEALLSRIRDSSQVFRSVFLP